jgi:hypothetical protein
MSKRQATGAAMAFAITPAARHAVLALSGSVTVPYARRSVKFCENEIAHTGRLSRIYLQGARRCRV